MRQPFARNAPSLFAPIYTKSPAAAYVCPAGVSAARPRSSGSRTTTYPGTFFPASRSLRVSGRRVRSAARFVRQPDNNLPRYVLPSTTYPGTFFRTFFPVLVLSVGVETRNVVKVTHVGLGWPEAVRDAWDRSDVMCWPASP